MEHPKHLSPNHTVQRLVLMQTLAIAKPMEEFATWLLTGIAVILGAVIVNVKAVSDTLTAMNLRWGLTFLVVSLVAGAISKQIGLAIVAGRALSDEMYGELKRPEVAAALEGLATTASEELKKEISSAFLPPIDGMMRRSFERGGVEPLAGERRLTKLWCFQLYFLWGQNAAAVVGLLTLAFGINS